MGIPHLTSTLEPYATHQLLHDDFVVIDGPALAYHIYHISRGNGSGYASCSLLGRSAVAWLDQLTSNEIVVDAIYFDGYLPTSKLPVRMDRSVKSTSQLTHFHSANPQGCDLSELSSGSETPLNPFELRRSRADRKAMIPPAFLVPAVIEALSQSSLYRKLVRLVPGEADAYCAQHVSKRGGIVLTSDSDLLAHNLGDGRVAFLRDVHLDADSKLACSLFYPKRIAQTLGITPPDDLCRLAYERKLSPQASLAQIKQACLGRIMDEQEYHDFCQQYVKHETSPLPVSSTGRTVSLDGLDPRISELVLQLGQASPGSDHHHDDARIFLPHLLESHSRGTAWEQSMPIRQLAYTVARWLIPGADSPVYEYRRVQSVDQRGRRVDLMLQDEATEQIDSLLQTMSRLARLTPDKKATYWTLLCLILDSGACGDHDKQSHVLRTLQMRPSSKPLSRVSWDHVHFTAHIQAGYYSLRILKQILALGQLGDLEPLPSNISQLRDALSNLPPLAEFPNVEDAIQFLQDAKSLDAVQIIGKFVHIANTQAQTSTDSFKVQKKRKRQKQATKPTTVKKGATSANMFGLLALD